jgi:branched-chain amino acid transport system substrate-binding protein
MKKLFIIPALLVSTSFFYSCGDNSENQPKTEKIKIGVLFPFGQEPTQGETAKNASLMAAEEINKAGGVLGKSIEIVFADDDYDKETGKTQAQALINQGVVGIVGALSSSVTIAVSSVTVPANITLMSPGSSSEAITSLADNNLVWRTQPSDAFLGKVFADYVSGSGTDELGKKTIGIIYLNSAFGVGLKNSFKQRVESAENSGHVVREVAFPELDSYESFDFTKKVDSVFLDKPDAVYIIAYQEDGAKIVNTINSRGIFTDSYKPLLLGGDSQYTSDFVNNTPDNITNNMIIILSQGLSTSANYSTFKASYKAKYNKDPQLYGENTYDAVYLMAYAMLKAGNTTSTNIAANLKAVSEGGDLIEVNEFAKAKQKIEAGVDIDYNGASGKVDFDSNGDLNSGDFKIFKITNKTFELKKEISAP